MRNLAGSFTMRKDGILPRGDWFTFDNKTDEKPKVYIYDEIGFWGTEASEFVKQLNEIDSKVFELHLNSPGGEIFDGLAIYNAIKQHKASVEVFVDGLAASAASFIAQAGNEVIMARNAQMMIHDGIAFAYGNEQDMLDTAALLGQLSNNIADIYAYRAGQRGFDTSLEDFRDLMREEVWYNGKEAVEAGLADVVLDQDDEEAESAKNKWDLSFYNHAGREKAESPLRVQEKIRLANRQKEMNMPKGNAPKATVDPEATPAPPTDPAPPSEPVETPADPDSDPVEEDPQPVEEEQSTEGGAAENSLQPSNSAAQQGVMIGGKLVTDWQTINQHFASLQAAQSEQRSTFRKEFVEKMARENKITATQVDSLVTLVNGDGDTVPEMSDEQFAAFQASYESAPASTLFQQHATTAEGQQATASGDPIQMTAEARSDRIAVLEGTVAMHKRTMPEDKVKATKSYIELQQLLGANNES